MLPTTTTKKVSNFQFNVANMDIFDFGALWSPFTASLGFVCVVFVFCVVSFGAFGVGQSERRDPPHGHSAPFLHERNSG